MQRTTKHTKRKQQLSCYHIPKEKKQHKKNYLYIQIYI